MAKQYLNVTYKDRDLAKRLGAKWDPSVRRWYCPAGSPLSKIFSWRKKAQAEAVLMAANHNHLAHDSASRAKAAQQPTLFELPLAS